MTYPDYLDFDLELVVEGSTYIARVLSSPKGEAEAHVTLPFDDDKLENVILKLGRTRSGVRRLGSPQQALAKTFGSSLYDSVFAGEVGTCFRRSLDEADRQGKGLRVRLRLTDAPALSNVPWEYLYPEGVGHFLVLSQKTPVVRYLDLPREVAPLAVQPPLRVLLVVSGPSDLAVLDTAVEMQNLQTALAGLLERGLVQLDILPEPSLSALRRALRTSTYHVLHFIGHGGYDEAGGDGVLAFEDEHGHSHKVSGGDLGTMLHDHTTLRLAVLNACEGARTSPQDPFSGVAQALVQQGLPAVVAMQFEITDDAAIELSQEFYSALSDGYPVDAALAEGRKAVFGNDNDVEWGTPVLYLRARDGRIFDVSPSQLLPPVVTEVPAEQDEPPPVVTVAPVAPPLPEAPPDVAPAAAAAGVAAMEGWFRTDPAPQPTPPPPVLPLPPASATSNRRATDRAAEPSGSTPPEGPTTAPARTEDDHGPRLLPVALVVGGITVIGAIIALVVGGAINLGGSTGADPHLPDGFTVSPSTDATSSDGNDTTDPGAVQFTALPGTASVDGDGSEWPEPLTAQSNVLVAGHDTGLIGFWAVMWDEQALYLLAGVNDLQITQLNSSPAQMWRGDGVSIELGKDAGARDPGAGPRSSDAQYIFGVTPGQEVFNSVNRAKGEVIGAGEPSDEIQAQVRFGPAGYVLEAAIPWSLTGITPATGTVVSVNFNVSDADPTTGDLASMKSSNPARTADQQPHPGIWQRMVLG